jgi:hypothetical protein
VLPQDFRDSPHLFGQALTKDLLDWQHPRVTLLQYADDLLLCGSTKLLVFRATESLLNFGLLRLQGLERKSPTMPSSGYLPWHDPGGANLFLKS